MKAQKKTTIKTNKHIHKEKTCDKSCFFFKAKKYNQKNNH